MTRSEVPRVTLTDGGPVLVEGPVDLETPDGPIAPGRRTEELAVVRARRSP